jgi:hypothetical protein
MKFKMKRNDRKPSMGAILQLADGTPQDLTGASVKFFMRKAGTTGTPKVNGSAVVVVNAATGSVRYDWGATDCDTAGAYEAEFEATLATGEKITFPNDSDQPYIDVAITGDIG